jgi:hypothetical protein
MKLIVPKRREVRRDLDFLVTGTGRCGTVHMAKLLTSIGHPCGHESIFTPNGLEYALRKLRGEPIQHSRVSMADGRWLVDPNYITAESSYMSAPFLRHKELSATIIIHVVRHPLRVVFSFRDGFDYFAQIDPQHDPYQRFIYHHLPELKEVGDPLSRACLFYVLWNEMIEKNAPRRVFHHIEDGPETLLDIILTDDPEDEIYTNTKSNSRIKEFNHTLDEIPEGDIKNRFIQKWGEYGYSFN